MSFCNLWKGETSLSLREDNTAFFPNIGICPSFFDGLRIGSFERIQNDSIQDFLRVSISNFGEKER